MFSADFNGDGKPDLLSGDGTLQLGNGNGIFTAGTQVPGTPLAVADFNGDGKPDVLESGTGTLLVLLGNGDGTFKAAVTTASAAALQPIAATDLNGDGKADAVGIFGSNLVVYLSKGDGTFAAGVSYGLGVVSPGSTIISFRRFQWRWQNGRCRQHSRHWSRSGDCVSGEWRWNFSGSQGLSRHPLPLVPLLLPLLEISMETVNPTLH